MKEKENLMNRMLQYTLGVVFSICLMIVLLFTSVEAAVYWIPGYFEKEYTKYNVTEAVSMNMDDLLDVTDQMMAYLKGKRDNLHVPTTMGGVEREFFNAREIAHMEDVRGLFLGGISMRTNCLLIMALCLILLKLLKTKFKSTFPKAVCAGSGLFFLASAATALLISTDFNRYFIRFHEMFFQNDLWMLDPSTDMLINIVPEGFFSDTVFLIGTIFFISVLFVVTFCLFLVHKYGKNAD
jgi:integral membrane protein (TIGR01906 family)